MRHETTRCGAALWAAVASLGEPPAKRGEHDEAPKRPILEVVGDSVIFAGVEAAQELGATHTHDPPRLGVKHGVRFGVAEMTNSGFDKVQLSLGWLLFFRCGVVLWNGHEINPLWGRF
ncbi:MAG: hypothetical protein M3R06_04995 [Chloroflexota bacterium]|nr:hypothetical protein [Chloroflexota bacterium]